MGRRLKKMKGQTAVFEEVMLFGIGVGIFIASFFIFNHYQNLSLEITGEDHMNEILHYLTSEIVEISRSDGNVTIIVQIPERINDNYYSIVLDDTGLTIQTIPEGKSVSSNLYGVQDNFIIRDNTIASISNKIMIYKKGMEIGINTINI